PKPRSPGGGSNAGPRSAPYPRRWSEAACPDHPCLLHGRRVVRACRRTVPPFDARCPPNTLEVRSPRRLGPHGHHGSMPEPVDRLASLPSRDYHKADVHRGPGCPARGGCAMIGSQDLIIAIFVTAPSSPRTSPPGQHPFVWDNRQNSVKRWSDYESGENKIYFEAVVNEDGT